MLTPRMNLGVGAIRDMRDAVTGVSFNAIYAIGGYSGKSILGTAEKYDIQLDTWTEIAPMKTPRRNVGESININFLYTVCIYLGRSGSDREPGVRSGRKQSGRRDSLQPQLHGTLQPREGRMGRHASHAPQSRGCQRDCPQQLSVCCRRLRLRLAYSNCSGSGHSMCVY